MLRSRPARRRAAAGVLLGLAAWWAAPMVPSLSHLPEIPSLARQEPPAPAIVRLRLEEARRRRKPIGRAQIPVRAGVVSAPLRHAVLAAEDPHFSRHRGVDPGDLKYALMEDVRHCAWVRGGSTLTMQLARTLYLSPEKTLRRKACEMVLALAMERHLSKARILELYLNNVEWGDGIYGCEAAARAYFGVPAARLDTEQAIRMASILVNPRRYGPYSRSPAMVQRRSEIVSEMLKEGYLADVEARGLAFP